MAPTEIKDLHEHPPLWKWLTDRNASCVWSQPFEAKPTRVVSIWRVNSGLVVIVLTAAGWSLFTEPNTNDIEATLADADERTGAHHRTGEHLQRW